MDINCVACDSSLKTCPPITLPCGNTICVACLAKAIAPEDPAVERQIESNAENDSIGNQGNDDISRSQAVNVPRLNRVDSDTASSSSSHQSLDEAIRLRRSSSSTNSSNIWSGEITPLIRYNCPVKSCHFKRHVYRNERVDFLLQKLLERQDSPDDDYDCPVCMDVLFEPTTTPCGHTSCRDCLLESMDHGSINCPTCRRELPRYTHIFHRPVNGVLQKIVQEKFAQEYAARQLAKETRLNQPESHVPVFVCSLIFPRTPVFLHIFEPRYRLMMHRVMSTNKRFGIALPTRNGRGFQEYGCMVEITHLQPVRAPHEIDSNGLPRYLVQGIGIYRFKVREKGVLDDYNTALIERIEDYDAEDEIVVGESISDDQGTSMQELMAFCKQHIQQFMATMSVLERRQFEAQHGQMPIDPADFSFWLASVLPVSDYKKYELLTMTSARERLEKLSDWIRDEVDEVFSFRRSRCDMM